MGTRLQGTFGLGGRLRESLRERRGGSGGDEPYPVAVGLGSGITFGELATIKTRREFVGTFKTILVGPLKTS
jgi:hypothetical protein